MAVYQWLLERAEILSLSIDFLALLITIVLTVAIYKLERRHEKDQERAEKRAKELAIKESAKIFLIDNDEEIEYLPFAEIAKNLNLKRKHSRNVITRYLRCSEQLQQEILAQAKVPELKISMTKIQTALELLQADLEKYNFGRNILYDGAKYLHRAFERWSAVPIENVNPIIFEDLRKSEWFDENPRVSLQLTNDVTSLYSYMWDYLHPEEFGIKQATIEPPIDMVFRKCNLGVCEESEMTFWTMRIIIDACHIFKDSQSENVLDESLIKTQEDMYYYTLNELYNAYIVRDDAIE